MKHCKQLIVILLLALTLTACGVQPQTETAATAAVPTQWLPTLTIEASSPTGATIVFQQTEQLEGYLLLSGNDYRLQRYADGAWNALPALVEDVFWTEAAFVVTAIPRENVDWAWLYGTLTPGRYRIGKTVTLSHNGEALDTGVVYGEFTIPQPEEPTEPEVETTEPAAFQPTPLYTYEPLRSVPSTYSHRDAAQDHVVVLSGGSGVENRDLWLSFVYRTQQGETGTVRLMDYDLEKGTQSVYDVTYDGMFYTVSWLENGTEKSIPFKHLTRMQGDLYHDPNATDRYVLTMDQDVTWEDIQWGMVSDNPNDAVAHKVVYQERSYHPSHAPIPDSDRVVLSLRGQELRSVTGETAEKMATLFADAQAMEEAPSIYYKGLDLIFYGKDGSEMTLWLDLYGDHFVYDGTFYQYSTQAMFNLFGITDWPEEIVFPSGGRAAVPPDNCGTSGWW